MSGPGNADRKPKFSWGQMSRACVRCGLNGPRIPWAFGQFIHFYCLTPEEKAQRRREQRR